MKKFILWAIVACILVACGGKTGKAAGGTDSMAADSLSGTASDKHSEAYIRQRIDTIYQFVGKTSVDAEGNLVSYYATPEHEKASCSARFLALMQEAEELCEETGDILYDYDYWVCGQDISDDWSYRVAKVYNVTDSTALVDLIIHNFSDIEKTIALRFERDDWFIDDFNPTADEDDKSYLRRMIKEGRETREKVKTLAPRAQLD
ncbi:MAG: DUF3828 domain-containing protein [Prevotella sp.]|nr:DUF3828 domain-containing protein [Prevotella sp.]